MKKRIAAGIAIICIGLSGATVLHAQGQSSVPTETTKPVYPLSYIDDIGVPFEVLDYAQMKYQGFAVTQARKSYYQGQSAYRLRVDRDSSPDDYDSIHLYYDMNWKLLGEERMVAPPVPVPVPEPPSEPQPEPEESAEPGGVGGERGDEETPPEEEEDEEDRGDEDREEPRGLDDDGLRICRQRR